MATKKTKANSRSKMASESGEAKSMGNVTINNYEPRKEEIREKAREIYLERLARNEDGTSEEDWLKAEKLLKGESK